MKRAFTTFASSLRRVSKSYDMNPASLVEDIWKSIAKSDDQTEAYGTWASASMQLDVIENKATHLFITSEAFADWLVGCVSELGSSHAAVLQQEIGISKVGVIHFPTSSRKSSCCFKVPKDPKIPQFDCDGRFTPGTETELNGKQFGLIVMTWSAGNAENLAVCQAVTDEPCVLPQAAIWYAKLIVGLGMYINCFPETVKDGFPDDLKHPSHHQYNDPKTIGIAEAVCFGGTHDSPMAHFRRGHFRVLRSEKFKNKRFQAVFVRETFVNGKAKTVLSPEEVAV
jgi:hypothetical protein